MPYAIAKTDGKFSVVNTDTGSVKSKATTRTKAEKQINLLRGLEHGWKPSGSYADFVRVEFKKRPSTTPASQYMRTIAERWRAMKKSQK